MESVIFPIYFYSIKDLAKSRFIDYNEDEVRATERLYDWLLENKK